MHGLSYLHQTVLFFISKPSYTMFSYKSPYSTRHSLCFALAIKSNANDMYISITQTILLIFHMDIHRELAAF